MKSHSLVRALLLSWLAMALGAQAESCDFVSQPAGQGQIGRWIDRGNWLAEPHRRLTLQSAEVFMPTRQHLPAGGKPGAGQPLADNLPVRDPLDGSQRDLAFVLDSQLRADAVLVLRNGKLVGERYRHGYRPEQPRLLLGATRPLLNLLGSVAIAQGAASADKSISRLLPELSHQASLRKLSLQRLLENNEGFTWGNDEVHDWAEQVNGGVANPGGVRAWLAADVRWPRKLYDLPLLAAQQSPDADLLAWTLSSVFKRPLAEAFCEQLFRRYPPQYPVHWLTDLQGNELGNGLALSLRDFASLGQVLLDARTAAGRSRVPGWLVESLAARSGLRTGSLPGLPKGSEARYGFVHLGGSGSRIALLGDSGASLLVDFDRRLVVAIYARPSVADDRATLDGLLTVWDALGRLK